MASTSRNVGARGLMWRPYEVDQLVNLWGEQRVQDALRNHRRNIDIFESCFWKHLKGDERERVRGFNRPAQECYSKGKTIRLNYKHILSNMKWSGAGHLTCPYFESLHSILGGDASVTLRRVGQSLEIRGETFARICSAPSTGGEPGHCCYFSTSLEWMRMMSRDPQDQYRVSIIL